MEHCPKCFQDLAGATDHCGMPGIGDSIEQIPSVSVALTGFTGNGKTVLLESMLTLLKWLPKRLSGFSVNALDDQTAGALNEIPANSLPPGTDGITRILINAYGVPIPGSLKRERRLMFFYDTAGECYDQFGSTSDAAVPLVKSDHIWLIYNPLMTDDTEGRGQGPINAVFQSIVNQHLALGEEIRGKNVVVVFTNGDELLEFLPPNDQGVIADYLDHDDEFSMSRGTPGNRPPDMDAYMSNAERISDLLESATRKMEGGPSLLDLAKEHGVKLRFCIIESFGHQVDDGVQHGARDPKRVLDPLWWSLNQDSGPNGDQPRGGVLNVIIDSDQKSLFEKKWPTKIWESLKSKFKVNHYFLGRQQPVAEHPSPPPTESLGKSYANLVGPILENSGLNDRFLLICNSRIPMDLEDFHENDSIRSDLLLAVTNNLLADEWYNTVILNDDSQVAALQNRLTAK